MEITNKEMSHIKNSLRRGDKGKLANKLGILAPALSRYLAPKNVYDPKTRKFKVVFDMPEHIYSEILIFISNKEINN